MEYYLSLLTFTLVTCITPGPNNLMLLAFGFWLLAFGFWLKSWSKKLVAPLLRY